MTQQLITAAKALLAEMWVIPAGAFANSRLIENRHLYALRAAVEAAEKQKPVGLLTVWRHRSNDSMVNTDFDYLGDLPRGTYPLYTAPVAQQEVKPLSDEDLYKVFRKESLHHESWPGFKAGWKAAHEIAGKP